MSNTYPSLSSGQGLDPPAVYYPLTYGANVNQEILTNHERIQPYNPVPSIYGSNEMLYQAGTTGCIANGTIASNGIPRYLVQQHVSNQRTLEMLLHAKDQSIKQKNEIIDKQNQCIEDLRKQLQQRNNSSNENLLRRLQDREGDVEHLRMRLETEAAPKYEAERLRKMLGETEYELEKTEKVLEDIIKEKKSEMEKFSGQVMLKAKELGNATKEIIQLKEENMALKTRIESLDKYVSELPTCEDHKRLRRELKHWKKCCFKLQNQMSEQEEKFSSGRKDLEEKAVNADRFEKENSDLKQIVKSLQDMMKKDEVHSKTMELEHVKFENERLQADLENMEKLLKENQKKTKGFYLRSKESQQKLVERLSQEEDTVAALREEVATKEISMSEVKSSMKQLSAQLTDLVEEKMDLSDKLRQLINSKEALETNRKVHKQLRRCVNKLKDIMRMFCQRKEGKDLDLSLLMGTAGSHDSSKTSEERPLTDEVRELTDNIEELRTFIADQYAEELANNLEGNCVTQ